jgi:hypothetical protein
MAFLAPVTNAETGKLKEKGLLIPVAGTKSPSCKSLTPEPLDRRLLIPVGVTNRD